MKILYSDVLRHDFQNDKLRQEDVYLAKTKKSNFIMYILTGFLFYLFLLLFLSPFILEIIGVFKGHEAVLRHDSDGWNVIFGITIVAYCIHSLYKVKLNYLRAIIYYYQRDDSPEIENQKQV